jgi:squalene-hopene/tetraprenyl-beta-curcumene cyclase
VWTGWREPMDAARRAIALAFGRLWSERSLVRLLTAVVLVAMTYPVWEVSSAQTSAPAPPAWDRAAAGRYLDQRMDEWFAKAEQLQTGDRRVACVSCHTVIPYALVRPALRRTMKVAAPTPQEQRLFEDTSRRVRTYDAHQLLYDFDEDKKDESESTEAVLYAFILAALDADRTGAARDDVTRRAFDRLWARQRDDGGWEWLDVGLEPFESSGSEYQGAAFAALAVTMAPAAARATDSRRGLERLTTYLHDRYSRQNLHSRLWAALVSASIDGLLSRADKDALVSDLARLQNGDGGWSLDRLGGWQWDRTTPPYRAPGDRDASIVSVSDGYATGLIVYALRQAGEPANHPLVARGTRWLEANQRPVRVGDNEWPAWRAHSLNYDREHGGARGESWRRLFMSDAATAFATLALLSAG